MSPLATPVDVRLRPGDLAAALRSDVRRGLTARPRELPAVWLYDERGCELFERITRLPEYYPARAERAILEERSGEVGRLSGADTFVELGSGSSRKSLLLLAALARAGTLRRYVPFDVAEPTLRRAAAAVLDAHPGLVVEGVVGDFRRHLDALPGDGRRLVAVLGGTIGNLRPPDRASLLGELARRTAPGDTLLLGADLVKDRRRLVAAYDDTAGVTAAFNRNLLVRLNRELGADFEPARFAHVARFDDDHEWIEMRLRARTAQAVTVPAVDLRTTFAPGEDLRTEISAKFRRAGVEAELAAAGFEPWRWWTDPAGDYALSLSVR